MTLAFFGGDFDQHLLVDNGRPAQQRSCDGNFVSMRELADQAARRVREHRQAFGQFGAVGGFGVGDEAGQDAVEQIDVIGAKARGPLKKKVADAARGVGTTRRVATSDDIVKFRDQRWRGYHKPIQNQPFWRAFGQSRQGL